MEEKEISLTDLIFDLLLRWRMFLLWAVIGVVLFSGFSYVKSWRQAKAEEAAVAEAQRQLDEQKADQQEQEGQLKPGYALGEVGSGERAEVDEEDLEEAASLLDEKQLSNVEYVIECEKWYRQRLDYLENSPFFQIDAGDVKKATVTAWIDASSEEQALAVKIAYENAIRNGEAAQFAAEKLGISAPYLTDLISLYTRTGNSFSDQDDHCVTVVLTYPDEQGCEELAQAIAKYLESKKSDFATVGGSYSLKVLQQDVCSVSDESIIDKQQSYYDGAIAAETAIIDRKAAFTPYELQYYDICTNGKLTSLSAQKEEGDAEEETAAENPKAIIEKGVTTVPGISLKYALLGFLLMAMAYAVYACFAYSFHARVQENDDFMQLFGIPQLGLIPAQQGKKKFLGFVDTWILSLRDKNKRKFSKEEAIQLSSVAVKMAAARNDADEVSLVCSGFQEDALAVCGVIKDDLAKENTKASILNNVLYDAAVMEDLEDSKAAVLVAKAGSTLYDELVQELELLKRQEIPVLGGIVIG